MLFKKRRNNEISNTILKDVVQELKDSEKKICSMEQAGTTLICLYSTNQVVERDVIMGICERIDYGWMIGLKDLIKSII